MNRRGLLTAGSAALAASTVGRAAQAVTPIPFAYSGKLTQGGWMILRTEPFTKVTVEGEASTETGAGGLAIIGFDRDAPKQATIVTSVRGQPALQPFPIAPVAYNVQHIDGLPEDQVAPSDPALLERIKRELAMKSKALASQDKTESFRTGFVLPVDHAVRTSAFGPQRILNGVPKTPHYGVDLAVPQGTPIHAPADGLVVLAEPHMHFEGGLTLIDHGQGLISMYLHQSHQDVAAGERVKQGQKIGAVGMTGRATGPHLCWRMTWRGRHMDPSLMVGAHAPV